MVVDKTGPSGGNEAHIRRLSVVATENIYSVLLFFMLFKRQKVTLSGIMLPHSPATSWSSCASPTTAFRILVWYSCTEFPAEKADISSETRMNARTGAARMLDHFRHKQLYPTQYHKHI